VSDQNNIAATGRHRVGSPLAAAGPQPGGAAHSEYQRQAAAHFAPQNGPAPAAAANPHSEYRRQAAQHFTESPASATPKMSGAARGAAGSARSPLNSVRAGDPTQRWDVARDACAAILLIVALLLPWNIYFGTGVPGSSGGLFAVLFLATVLSAGAIVVTYAGAGSVLGAQFDPARAAKLRLALNTPYLLLVLAFVGFTIIQTVRYSGTGTVPPGFGPGAWFGLAGSMLSAQPVITGARADDARLQPWESWTRRIAIASIVLAVLSTLFNVYWRTEYMYSYYTLGKTEVAVIVLTVVYAAVALAAVVIGCKWILQDIDASPLAVIALGTSSLVAGFVVWSVGVGREIDAFHGIAENTSTAAVGYEGYLAWVTAAAIFAPLTLRAVVTTKPIDKALLRAAAQKVLTLIAFWCFASIALRITDFIVAVSLGLHHSPYDFTALIGFDGVTAVLAIWLRVNFKNRSAPARVISALCAALFVFTISRIVVGVALAPRIVYVDGGPPYNPVYGNTLAQQITSTFDVVVCGLALCVLTAAIVIGQLDTLLRSRRRSVANADNDESRPAVSAAMQPQAVTTKLVAAAAAAPAQPTGVQEAKPQIFRVADTSAAALSTAAIESPQRLHAAVPAEDSTQQLAIGVPKIFSAPSDSTEKLTAATPDGSTSAIFVATPEDSTQQLSTSMPKIFRVAGDRTEKLAAAAPAEDSTQQLKADTPAEHATQQMPTGAANVQRLLADSTQRFAAGTTYTGPSGGRTPPASPPPPPPPAARPAPPPTSAPQLRNPAPTPASDFTAPTPPMTPQPYAATAGSGYSSQPAAAPGSGTPAAGTPVSADQALQWLSSPQHLKLVIGAVGLFIGVIVFFAADDPVAKLVGVGIAVAAWAVCFRHGYHEKAGLQIQTRIDPDEVTRIATDLAAGLQGPLSSVQFNGSTAERLDFTVRGVTWDPLVFHMSLRRDPSGWTFLSTHLDKWTWRRQRWNVIPVPFTKRMDGYGLYKSFGDRVLKALQERDPVLTGAFHRRLPQ
jgi:hypothetical protein